MDASHQVSHSSPHQTNKPKSEKPQLVTVCRIPKMGQTKEHINATSSITSRLLESQSSKHRKTPRYILSADLHKFAPNAPTVTPSTGTDRQSRGLPVREHRQISGPPSSPAILYPPFSPHLPPSLHFVVPATLDYGAVPWQTLHPISGRLSAYSDNDRLTTNSFSLNATSW